APHRADRVNDPLCRQVIAFGDFCLPGGAALELTAFLEQLRSRSAMNRAIHAASAQQACVGGIDDTVHLLLRNISFDNRNAFEELSRIHKSLRIYLRSSPCLSGRSSHSFIHFCSTSRSSCRYFSWSREAARLWISCGSFFRSYNSSSGFCGAMKSS